MSSAWKPCLWEADGPQVLPETWKLPAGPEERVCVSCHTSCSALSSALWQARSGMLSEAGDTPFVEGE